MARRWIFPILRILVLALIAAALVKLAFFADATEADSPAVPTGSVTDPVVTVELGTIVNDVRLAGTVSADAAVPVRATGQGTVDEVFIPQGATVSQGDKIFDIKVETPQDPVETTDAQGMVTVTQPKPLVTYAKVFAPVSGTLSSLTVLSGQAVAVGDQAGAVAPPSFSVSGPLGPEQQYRLLDRPTEASVTIVGGPAPFTCTGLTITAPLPGQTSGDGEAAPPAGAPSAAPCLRTSPSSPGSPPPSRSPPARRRTSSSCRRRRWRAAPRRASSTPPCRMAGRSRAM